MARPVPAEVRKGHNGTTPTGARSHAPMPMPDPPSGLGPFGVSVWTDVWTLGAGVYMPTALHVISRSCSLSERRHTLLSLVEADGWLTPGSTGQTVVHPAARMVDVIEGRLTTLEDRLGLNPEARLRLGITAVEHQSRLDAFLSDGGDA